MILLKTVLPALHADCLTRKGKWESGMRLYYRMPHKDRVYG